MIFLKKIREDKRASVPITLLVIGIFALCVLALFTFLVSDTNFSNSFVGIGKLSELNFKINQYEFLKSQGISDGKIQSSLGFIEEEGEKYFYLEKRKTSRGNGEDLEFSVKYKIPS